MSLLGDQRPAAPAGPDGYDDPRDARVTLFDLETAHDSPFFRKLLGVCRPSVVRIDAAVMMTKPLIVASRAVSGCLGSPGVSSGCLAATLCTDPAIGRFFPCPEGDPGGSEFHVACGPSWRVAIDRHNGCTEPTQRS